MYSLTIETDDDFSVVYKKKIYTGDFSLLVANHEELAIIKENLAGPHGNPKGGNYWDIKNCMQEIVDGALNDFNITGGNRAISWHQIQGITEIDEYEAGYLDGLDESLRVLEANKDSILKDREYFR